MNSFIKTLTIITALLTASLHAGSNTAYIKGETSSGRTAVEINVQDIEGRFISAKLTIDGNTYVLKNDENTTHETVIYDKANGVYILILESNTKVFKLWMIPGSEKVISKGDGHYQSSFAAVIEATDPREGDKYSFTPRITIGCTLKYSL